MKRAGPKGLPAESARAVTGRRCPHSGEGEDFLTHQPGFFFTKNDPLLRNGNFFGGGPNGKLEALGIIVISPVDKNYHTEN